MKYPEEDILSVAILEMAKHRQGKSFCPSEVVRWIYPNDWRHFMEDVNESMMHLYRRGLVVITQENLPVDTNFLPSGPVRIALKIGKDERITQNQYKHAQW